jgi:hypothetical protein
MFWFEHDLSENRYPLFRIMLWVGRVIGNIRTKGKPLRAAQRLADRLIQLLRSRSKAVENAY